MSFLVGLAISLVLMAVSYAITAATARRQPDKKPASVEDFDFPQMDEGTPQAVVFGDVWIDDWMVLWYGNFRVQAVRSRSGKK